MNGVWDRPRARKLFKDRQAVSALPATKLLFHTETKTMWSGGEKREKILDGFGDFLEQHFAACRGMKGGNIASPLRIGHPSYAFSTPKKTQRKSKAKCITESEILVFYLRQEREINLIMGDKKAVEEAVDDMISRNWMKNISNFKVSQSTFTCTR